MPTRSRLPMVLAAVGVLALVAILGGLWLWNNSRLVPDHGGAYVEAVAGHPQFINPLLAQFGELDRDLSSLVFSGLVKVSPAGRVEPDVAESWEISPDGKSYTFHLNADRKWHDGHPVDADDVLYTVRTLQDPDFPGLPDAAQPWKGVKTEKVDARTVRFTLPEPYAPFLEQAGLGLLPAHLLDKVAAADLPNQAFNGSPIGTGPFKVLKASVQQVTLVPDPGYPGPKPYLDSLVFRFYPSTRAAVTALQSGEATGVRYVPSADLAQLRESKDVQVLTAPQYGRAAVLFLNTRRAPFDDARVRTALALAVDRKALVDEALGGLGEPAVGPLSPLNWGYKAPQGPAYNPDQAQALLDQAGWKDSNGDGVRDKAGKPLTFALATSDAPERTRAATALARQLAKVGVKVEVAAQSWEELRDTRLVPRDYAAALAELSLPNRDPDVLPFWHSNQADGGLNFADWRNQTADSLLLKGRQTWASPAREAVYADFQSLFATENPAVFLYYPSYTYALRADVKGVHLDALLDPVDRLRTFKEWYIRETRAFF